jgi:hypothetical protein
LPHRPHRPPRPRPSYEVAFLKFENTLLSSLPLLCPASQLHYECAPLGMHLCLSRFFFTPFFHEGSFFFPLPIWTHSSQPLCTSQPASQ